jgi:hypothetical protein
MDLFKTDIFRKLMIGMYGNLLYLISFFSEDILTENDWR